MYTCIHSVYQENFASLNSAGIRLSQQNSKKFMHLSKKALNGLLTDFIYSDEVILPRQIH